MVAPTLKAPPGLSAAVDGKAAGALKPDVAAPVCDACSIRIGSGFIECEGYYVVARIVRAWDVARGHVKSSPSRLLAVCGSCKRMLEERGFFIAPGS